MAKVEGDPTHVFNHDVLFLCDMCNRYIEELMRSQSSGVSGMIGHDQERMKTYIEALRTKQGWVKDQPLLDLPETHPRPFTLEAFPEVVNVESEVVNQYVRLMEALRTELINSQSARLASTLSEHDHKRMTLLLDKMDKFMTDYVSTITPLDLPESSPREAQTGAGRKGV